MALHTSREGSDLDVGDYVVYTSPRSGKIEPFCAGSSPEGYFAIVGGVSAGVIPKSAYVVAFGPGGNTCTLAGPNGFSPGDGYFDTKDLSKRTKCLNGFCENDRISTTTNLEYHIRSIYENGTVLLKSDWQPGLEQLTISEIKQISKKRTCVTGVCIGMNVYAKLEANTEFGLQHSIARGVIEEVYPDANAVVVRFDPTTKKTMDVSKIF